MATSLKTLAFLVVVIGAAALVFVQSRPGATAAIDDAKVEALLKAAFNQAPAEWVGRIHGDETMQMCSAARNHPSAEQARTIQAAARKAIKYPDDGKLLGDWKQGERIAQSGYGMRFTDYPPAQANGGNCYACHQLAKAEVSYGTIGPSLLGYGKNRKFSEADTKAVYEKIYDSHAAFPCSLMPRFGANGVLAIEQIKDLTALVMSPDSPVNQ